MRDDFPTILCHETVGVGLAVNIAPSNQWRTCHDFTSGQVDRCPERDRFLAFREFNSLVVNESFAPAGGDPESTASSSTELQNKFRVRSTHENEVRRLL